MFVLYETPAGYALFKVLDEEKIKNVDEIQKEFETEQKSSSLIKLKSFYPFENMKSAVEATAALVDGKLSTDLQSFLKAEAKSKKHTLAVMDTKLGAEISKTLGISVVSDNAAMELFRGIRSNCGHLLSAVQESDLRAMTLGLSHSLSRYRLKFSPDKIDTMIVQAISLLDDLDKELNTYCMRLKEWYGWHFPELAKIVADNVAYARVVRKVGIRQRLPEVDLSDVIPEELVRDVAAANQISMGTDISEDDILNISHLAEQVISINQYRQELFEYLRNRMHAIAPNLTAIVGEIVGARLISHSGSLMSLAKAPASTVQILGSEKALFRALKNKQDTPKYGLIYHAALIGQTAQKAKGTIARVLAAKTALAVRCDAFGEVASDEVGIRGRQIVEARIKSVEEGLKFAAAGSVKKRPADKKSGVTFSSANSGSAKRIHAETDVSSNKKIKT